MSDRLSLRGYVLALVACLFFSFIIAAALIPTPVADAKPKPSSVVKIMLPNGHGSGVAIGGGFIITAAHVTHDAKDGRVKLKNSTGSEFDGEVLWQNETYDVALVRGKNAVFGVSSLACRTPVLGEEITASGSPLQTEFSTFWGHVSGMVQKYGPWPESVTLDASITPGISGGPVFDKDGNVIGIAVGVALAKTGFTASMTGIGIMVPAQTICPLLARQ